MKSHSYALVLRRLATLLAVGTLTLCLVAAVTGILLSLYYEPAAGRAYRSLQQIATEIPNGWLVLGLHNGAGKALIALSLIQIVVMFLGRRYAANWLMGWLSGILLTLNAMALSWTAMILDWSELGYWRLRIELGIIEGIPGVGPSLRNLITGDGGIDTLTVERLYTVHSYLLPASALLLGVVHLGSTVLQVRQDSRVLATIQAISSQASAEPDLTEVASEKAHNT
jgi:cytochrome b6